ncbi:hypothetical protein [Novosphingobium sp. fls2-241-R2A-195]|uniref:hypothetical protein n=1 Tax=Novosphingobium sp. fls2-241-R2A-195 TaxID=3040296 RepID=UPI00254EA08F|nr:hypothetical protein [Novosphingobium sp. fls2-241-R2A-195]
MAAEMGKHVRTTIRYDGPALAGHEMDAQDLAPALLALADLVQIANRRFNGTDTSIKVLVSADVEQRCFMIDVSLVQSFLDQAKVFLGTDHVKTVWDIAQWVGLLGGGTTGLFQLLKFLTKAKENGEKITVNSHGLDNVIVTGDGNTIIIPREVYLLANEPKAVEKAKGVMRPLAKEGYETLAFLEGDHEIFEVDAKEASGIDSLPNQPLSEVPTETHAHIRGEVRIKSAQYEGAAQWGFLWNGRAINAEMAEAALIWVAAFQANKVSAPPNSILDVSMIETVQLDSHGMIVGKPSYKVVAVHGVKEPPRQYSIF